MGRTDPIKVAKGFSFPVAEHLNCYIRICRPKSTLDFLPNLGSKKDFKEDNTTDYVERYEVDGYWSTKL